MKADAVRHPQEIELKLALPMSASASVALKLAKISLLSRRKATHQRLHNVYFDTSEQTLRSKRVALRIRRTGSDANPRWLQTLKTGGRNDSVLSQRGEWETPIPEAVLALRALAATPWAEIDPDGTVFPALAPCFVTDFRRTSWSVRRRDGSIVEVSLDIGQIEVGDKSAPICELELELIAGQPAALFDVAQQIAQTIAVIPASTSKAERGYRLVMGTLNAPTRAQVPVLTPDMTMPEVAQRVLREMFNQFTSNLGPLLNSDDPEVVHQARIGWRRFKSALRLFRPVLAVDTVPSWQPLQPLQTFLGELRDLDVALIETLPPLRDAFAAGSGPRLEKWQALTQALTQAATLQRKSVKYALMDPAVGAALLSIAHWLEELFERQGATDVIGEHEISVRRWARRRIARLHDQLRSARKIVDSPESLHRVRILAKRLRYGIEALRPLLPPNRAQRWCDQAAQLQASVGSSRDVMQACALASKLEVDSGVVEFLRGFCVGKELPG